MGTSTDSVEMGGGPRFDYPKFVWSPSGGWWTTAPPGWKRNTGIALGAVFVLAAGTFYVSAKAERRNVPLVPIPSQRWSHHTAEDDPEYPQRIAEYRRTRRASSPACSLERERSSC